MRSGPRARVLIENGTGYKRRIADALRPAGDPMDPNPAVPPLDECLYAGEQFTNDEERRYGIVLPLADYHADRRHRGLAAAS